MIKEKRILCVKTHYYLLTFLNLFQKLNVWKII